MYGCGKYKSMATRILRSTATLVSSLSSDLLRFRDIVPYFGVGGLLELTARTREKLRLAMRDVAVSMKMSEVAKQKG